MKRIRIITISVVLTLITLISVFPSSAKKLTSIKMNYDYHYGIDVSTWNRNINIDKIKKSNVEFAIIRIGYYKSDGGHLDVRFKENVKKCAKNGIEFGVYVYSYVYSKSANLKCAKWVHKNLKAMGNYCKNVNTIPVAYDIEDKAQSKAVSKHKISRKYLFDSVCKFCNKIKSYGYPPVVYSFQGFFKSYLNITKLQKKGYKIWYAQWPYFNHLNTTVKKMMYNGTYADIWQFSDALTIGGKVFDTNVCYDDFYDYSKEDSNIKIEGLSNIYSLGNSASKKPSFKVYNGSKLLKKDTDYKLIYFKNNRAGKAKIKIIVYKNNSYYTTKTVFFDLKPRIPQNIKTKSYKNKISFSWTKSKGASYYEIFELDENDGTYNQIDKVKSNSYINYDLEPGSNVSMKIRAVYNRNGKKYSSAFKSFSAKTKG